MKKILNFAKDNTIFHYLLMLILTILVCIPFFRISILTTGDSRLHLLRIIGFSNSVKFSNFPYLISPFFCNNFGYATNLFYPQLVTYIPYFLNIFTNSYETAMELFTGITIFLSGIFMYNFTRQVTKNKIVSLISGIIYMTYAYRLDCIYERFAIGEFTAMMFIPILFEGLYNLVKQDKTKHYLITIGTVGMLLSHSVTTIYAALFCVIYIVFNIKSFFKKDVIKLCAINIFFIIAITALFTVPMLEHKMTTKYTIFDADAMNGTGGYVYENSATLKQLFTDKDSDKTVSFIIGNPIILFLMLSIFVYKKLNIESKDWYSTFGIMGIISIYMVTRLFPWIIMPKVLTMVQFTWRLLVFFSFFVTPICAINIYTVAKEFKNKKIAYIFLIACATVLAIFTAIRLNEYVQEKINYNEKYEHYEERVISNPIISQMSINREYLPEKCEINNYKYMNDRSDNVYILSGNGKIENEEKHALNMSFKIQDCTNSMVLELPYIFYLGYNITLESDSESIELKYNESENGFVSIKIPENVNNAKISVRYTGTRIEIGAYLVSAISFSIFILYLILYKKDLKSKNENK